MNENEVTQTHPDVDSLGVICREFAKYDTTTRNRMFNFLGGWLNSLAHRQSFPRPQAPEGEKGNEY